jgi:hypothetical protein
MKSILLKLSSCVVSTLFLAFWTGSAVGADYPGTVLSFSPAGYWRLSETTAVPVASIAKNSGSLAAAADGYAVLDVTNGAPGVVGTSFRFTNPNGYDANTASVGYFGSVVDVPYLAELNPDGPFTVEFWAKPARLSTDDYCPLTSMDPDQNRSGWLFYQTAANRWRFRVGGVGGYAATANGGTIVTNAWQHIVGVFDGASPPNITIYVNGQKGDGPIPATGALGFNPNRARVLRVGATDFPNRGFDGWVDEVAIYGSALSPDVINSHYQMATTNSVGYAALILASTPVGYWHLDEPAYTAPNPGTLPVTPNSGTLGAAANGTNYPGLTAGVAGPPFSGLGANNTAIQLNGAVGNVNIGNPDGLNFADQITLMAWVKPTAQDQVRDIVAHGYSDAAEVFLRINGGGYEVGSADIDDAYGVGVAIPEGDIGNWVFLTGTWDGTAWNLYRNDALVASSDFTTGALQVDAPWSIGSRGDPNLGDARVFHGGIDEVAIFTNALTAAQIQQIFYSANVLLVTVPPQAPAGPVYEGSTVTFNVVAEGNKTLSYRWTKNGATLSGQTEADLMLSNVTTNDSGNYAVIVSNSVGSVTNSVLLTVLVSSPLITEQPQPAERFVGANATFSVRAIGSSPRAYQWKFNDTNSISGATAPDYTLFGIKLADAGNYSCRITNIFGSTNSANAALSVLAPPINYGAVILSDNPIAYWRLGETNGSVTHDYWGGHDGEYNNVTLGLPGYSVTDPDRSAGFGGIDTYVGGISGSAIDFSGTNSLFTLEAWVNGPASQMEGAGIIAKGRGPFGAGGVAGEQFTLDVNSGVFRFRVEPASGTVANATAAVGPDGTWQHLVAVYDGPGGSMQIYVNGQESGSATPPLAGPVPSALPVGIGARRGGVGSEYDLFFEGSIDEVAIYDKALTAEQVLAHFNSQYAPNTPPLIQKHPTSATNYVSWTVTLKVVAGGSPPLSYQWKKDSADIPGATNATLTISPLALTNAGSYRVVVNNPVGPSLTSDAATITVLPIPTSTIFSPGLVLHLPFDNSYSDTSGHNNHGAIVGATTFVPGKVGGQALHYSTVVDTNTTPPTVTANYVTLGVRPDLQFGYNVNFSVAYWVRLPLNYDQGDLPFLCNAEGSTFSFGYVFAPSYGARGTQSAGTDPGGWAWSIFDSAVNGAGVYGENNSINDGEWHHLAHTFDRTGSAITYLDGAPASYTLQGGTSASAAGDITTTNATTIGQDPTGKYAEAGEADLDDLGIWHRALTPLEVVGLYLAGLSNVSFTSGDVKITIQTSGSQLQLAWPVGTLQSTDDLSVQFSDVPNQTNPFLVTPSETKKFYRIKL